MTFCVFIKHKEQESEPSQQMVQFRPLECCGKCENCSEVINVWHEVRPVLLWRKYRKYFSLTKFFESKREMASLLSSKNSACEGVWLFAHSLWYAVHMQSVICCISMLSRMFTVHFVNGLFTLSVFRIYVLYIKCSTLCFVLSSSLIRPTW